MRMIPRLFWFAVLISTYNISFTQADPSLEQALYFLEDVAFEKIATPEGYQSCYQMNIRQPLDHSDPSKGFFLQKLYLSHRGFQAPMVMVTEGYSRPSYRSYELADHLDANQVIVEHRYYGQSVPDSMMYEYLDLEQATADLHRIRTLLGQIYSAPWVSTGISKGGMTTIFYRYFYPDDVVLSVPYVAPINLQQKDPRIYDFLSSIGSEACREDIENFQIEVLKRKDEILPLITWFSKGADLSFDHLGIEKAFEFSVLEYSFSFWQFGYDCGIIPDESVSTDSLLSHLIKVSGIDFFSDGVIDGYAPFYYQMSTEMGYYGYQTKPFKKYLDAVGNEPPALFPPVGVTSTFDAELTTAVDRWARTEAEGMIYINGGIDTWSATGIVPDDEVDALLLIIPDADHRSARISNMSADLVRKLDNYIEKYLSN